MTWQERVDNVARHGFTERQSAFLVTVMLHAGVCVARNGDRIAVGGVGATPVLWDGAELDPTGDLFAPAGYKRQVAAALIEQAVNGTKGLDQKKLAEYLHKNEMKTIVGPIRYGPDGEWASARVVQAQFRGVVDKNIDQFRQAGKQVILYPGQYKTGDVIAPFEKARGK